MSLVAPTTSLEAQLTSQEVQALRQLDTRLNQFATLHNSSFKPTYLRLLATSQEWTELQLEEAHILDLRTDNTLRDLKLRAAMISNCQEIRRQLERLLEAFGKVEKAARRLRHKPKPTLAGLHP
ncbi:MAG: hypothetical protein ACE5JX_14080 [Acidobacteriota bacterium]